jgi:hypothetical protein
MMSLEECISIIVDAMVARKRDVVMGGGAEAGDVAQAGGAGGGGQAGGFYDAEDQLRKIS